MAARLQALYEGARDMGWSDTKKRTQLTAPEARLLVVIGKVGVSYCDYIPDFPIVSDCMVLSSRSIW